MNAPPKAGRYALLDELGRGAMGVVYRAHDPVIGRQVAVKTVRLDAQAAGMPHEELLRRFQTEARAAGQLTHPNIVVVYDAGEDDGLFYITMELVEGRSLQQLLEKREMFPLPRVIRIMQQACSALDFAHQNRVVHRDIKPANLMLTPDDTLKITDFGTAKILRYGTVQTAQTIGTPSYMSPEQVKGRPVDGRSDIFSLGVVLYELVTGEKPFPGESVTTVIYKIVNEEPIPPRDLDSSIPPGLSAVISRALAKAPVSRFHTCREFMEALQNYRDFGGSAAGSIGAPQAAKLSAAAAGASTRAAATISTGQRAPLLAAAPPQKQSGSAWLALFLLAIIGGAGYRVWPALQEVWQRGEVARHSSEAPTAAYQPMAPSADVSVDSASSAAPADDHIAATPGESAAEPEPIPAKLAQPSTPAVPTPAVANSPVLSPVESPRAKAQPPAAPAGKFSSDAADPNAPAASPKDGNARRLAALLPTPEAARLQRRVEAALVGAGVSGKVQVTAVGNNVTLTGKLSPKAHGKLLSWLQSAPTTVQIIDDIEYAEETESPAAGTSAVPF